MTDNPMLQSFKQVSPEKARQAEKENEIESFFSCGYCRKNEDIWEYQPFCMIQHEGRFAYGVCWPRNIDATLILKSGKVQPLDYEEQIREAVIIDSEGNQEPYTPKFGSENKLILESVPDKLPIRWSLESRSEFIKGKTKKPNTEELFNNIAEMYQSQIFMPDIWSKVHAAWDMATYFYMLCSHFPIFELQGMRQTGKSRAMEVSRLLSFNAPEGIWVNPSEAVLFRDVHENRFTKYIDEAERLFVFDQRTKKMVGDARAEILNASFTRGSIVPRMERVGKTYKTFYYSTYSPTMVASIIGLHGATKDRAIIRVGTRPPEGWKKPEWPKDNADFQALRDDLHIWGLGYWKDFLKFYNDDSITKGMSDRERDIWRPLLAVGAMASPEIFQALLNHAMGQQGIKQADTIPEGSIEAQALEIFWEIIKGKEGASRVLVKDILSKWKNQFRPQPKTVSERLKNLGLRDYHKSYRNNSAFEITCEAFEKIIQPFYPIIFYSYSSLSSLSSLNRENEDERNNKNSEVSEEYVSSKSEERGEKEEREAERDYPTFDAHHKCATCGSEPTAHSQRVDKYLCAIHWIKSSIFIK